MNFLAHFELTSDVDSPAFQLGGLLPDFAKRAGFQLTHHKISPDHEFRFPELVRGIRLHWLADKQFHRSELFEAGNLVWRNALNLVEFPWTERKFFLYHLLFEMWLDRLLILQNPQRPERMYQGLELAGKDSFSEFSKQVFDDQNSRLNSVYQDFMERKFISAYEDSTRFAQIASAFFGYITSQKETKLLIEPIQNALIILEPEEAGILAKWTEFKGTLLPA